MRRIIIPLFFLIVFYSLIPACSDSKTQKKLPGTAGVILDSTYLFNGKTLDGWEITNFGPQGPVYVSGDQLMLGMGDGCTGVTWKGTFPESGYEVNLDAKRVAGSDFFCGITFPVSDRFCSLIVGGWGGGTVGLSSIDGKDASENETTLIRNFETNRWYHIRLLVTDEYIKSWIDTSMVVDFRIEEKKLSLRPEVELSKPFGITSWKTTAAVRNIRLQMKIY
jgi:hypothetical protein